jgi:TolB protein
MACVARFRCAQVIAGAVLMGFASTGTAADRTPRVTATRTIEILGEPTVFAPGIASTGYAEIRLTLSPDGRSALWFSRDRPGGAGGYDIWMSRRMQAGWSEATPAPFNSARRDFDPAYSSDGRFVYFSSDRPGTLGGDDVFRVAVTAAGFGAAENLGPAVNSAGNEWAPMLSAQGTLLFSSDRSGGAGGHDLYVAGRDGNGFAQAASLPGRVNTPANEFDATFLSDDSTIVFARAQSLKTDRIDLFHAAMSDGRYDHGTALAGVNSRDYDTYGPMLDWSRPDRITYSAKRSAAGGMDLYVVRYQFWQ